MEKSDCQEKGKRLLIKNVEEIRVRLKEEKDSSTKIKLLFLNLMVNLNMSLEKACEIFTIATPTGYLKDKTMDKRWI